MSLASVPAAKGSFVLNVFPAQFSSSTLQVYAGPYGDNDAFSRLVTAQDGWTAWRDVVDGARVYVWCHDDIATFARDGFRPVTVTASENAALFCRVLLEGIDRHLRALGFSRLGRNGYATWGMGNYLNDRLVKGFVPDPRVGIYAKILLGSFITRFDTPDPLIALVVDIVHTTRFDIPVDELLGAGFDVRGYYVKLRHGVGGPPACEGLMLGRVDRIAANELVLTDLRDPALAHVDPAWCILRPDRCTLDAYLRWRYPTHYRAVAEALDRDVRRLHSPKEKLRLIEAFVSRRLRDVDCDGLPLAAELSVTFAPAVTPSSQTTAFRVVDLPTPTYSFDPESPKVHTVPDAGLKRYGPYSQARMRERSPRILLLSPASYKGHVEQFVLMFQVGVHGYEHTYGGFARTYRLSGVDITEHYFEWHGQPAKEAYYNAAVDALGDRSDYDLCFTIGQESFKCLAPADDPHYVCKALLLSFGIPVQDVRIETLRQSEYNLQWTLRTLALATYAKLGGTPFVLRARQIRHHELVFGIGRSIERPPGSRLGATKQIIGFTTVFRSDGDYLLNACTPYSDFAAYERRLEEVILRSVGEVAAMEGIADGETIRLIFHVYKRTGRREVQAIQNAIGKLTRYRVEFALLHVNDSHDFKLFDHTNGGRDRRGHVKEALALIPPRQLMISIGPRERLITLIGPAQYRGRGTPTPLRLTLDRSSTFTDLDYLAQQAFEFSSVSCRSFNPTILPVTVYYSELMARLSSRLAQLAAWNQEIVKVKLKHTLWFI